MISSCRNEKNNFSSYSVAAVPSQKGEILRERIIEAHNRTFHPPERGSHRHPSEMGFHPEDSPSLGKTLVCTSLHGMVQWKAWEAPTTLHPYTRRRIFGISAALPLKKVLPVSNSSNSVNTLVDSPVHCKPQGYSPAKEHFELIFSIFCNVCRVCRVSRVRRTRPLRRILPLLQRALPSGKVSHYLIQLPKKVCLTQLDIICFQKSVISDGVPLQLDYFDYYERAQSFCLFSTKVSKIRISVLTENLAFQGASRIDA